MTHLTIETVECPGCGHSHTIEVDTEKAMKEAKEAFNRKHKDCQNASNHVACPDCKHNRSKTEQGEGYEPYGRTKRRAVNG